VETVTLRAEDFKTVHNTLCELRSIQERLTGVISNEMADRLHSVIKGFDAGLANAYEQDTAQFDRKHEHYQSVQEELSLHTVWSVYEVEDLNEPHPYPGAMQLCYRDHWGDEPVFVEIKGPTWADLYCAANSAIMASGDDHHIFIEQFKPNPAEPLQLILQTGS